VATEKSGAINVYVQGDLEDVHREKETKCVFLTVHDVGTNHSVWENLIGHETFECIKKRAVFIHVDIPGQEDNAEDLGPDFHFPSMQNLGEDLVTVLDQLRIKYCIGIGDGAGSNIIVRFGMMHMTRCLGVILLNPTTNKVTMMDNLKDRFQKWKITHVNDLTGEQMVAFRKFGHKLEDKEDKAKALEEFKSELSKRSINKRNLQRYIDSYMARVDISGKLAAEFKCDALLVVGSKSSQIGAAEYMHSHMDKTRTSLLKVDGVGNVVEDAPAKLANSILLFCKGLGWLTSVNLPGVERRSSTDSEGKPRRQRTISMEDYDKPNIRRLSVTSKE
jgi:pimeloyl-ACP methyl ester carboxylesterase